MRSWLFTICSFFLLNGTLLTQVLPLDEFLKIVKANHPVARQASLQKDFGEAQELIAQGGFDPKIYVIFDHKSFDGKNYYRTTNAQFKIPTWFGIELTAGYERGNGEFLNNREFLPDRGLWNAGLSIPLGKGLFIDERRAMLQQAKVFRSGTEQERRIILNELLFDAIRTYLDWQVAWQAVRVAEQGLQLSNSRFDMVRSGFMNGDLPAIDTLEALIFVQSRQQYLVESNERFVLSQGNLEKFLWSSGFVPLELQDSVSPQEINVEMIRSITDDIILTQNQIILNHPELLISQLKIDQLEIEEKLQREALKPEFRISFQPLVGTTQDALFAPFSAQNYKLGAGLEYPIFTRKERGRVQHTSLKIQETGLALNNKRLSIETRLNAYRDQLNLLQERVQLTFEIKENYNRLRLAENRKFEIGESSIFLVNRREVSYLESQLKLIETQIKLIETRLKYLFASGRIWEVI